MNEVLQALFNRRSVRRYKDEPIPAEKLDAILQAALVSESARNEKAYELVVVTDRALLQKMSRCRIYGGKHLEQAGAAVVVVGNPDSDTWIEDCVIVLANMHLVADSIGIGSCFVQGRLRYAAEGLSTDAYLRELLGYPETRILEGILVLGVPADHPEGYTEEDLPREKIHWEHY